MNKNLAIIGHPTRGKEVIEILEMLGGVNKFNLEGNTECWYVLEGQVIRYCEILFEGKGFTLEEFLEKYPYKIGDMIRVPEFESEVRINDMKWDGHNIQYEVFTDETEWYTAEELNNWNTKNIEKKEPNHILLQLKKYFEETPRDVIEKEWNELSYLNEIGPTVEEYLESVKKYRQTQYPKTITECYNRLEDNELVNVKTIELFRELINARNTYWKIAGNWEPDWKGDSWRQLKYCITINGNGEIERRITQFDRRIFAFPTEEMMNVFYENFKDLIKVCKNLI
jgi:hypothetical protein